MVYLKNEREFILLVFKKSSPIEFNYPTPTSQRTSVERFFRKKKLVKNSTISDRLWIGHKNRKIRNLKRGGDLDTGYQNQTNFLLEQLLPDTTKMEANV